jgi:hypothetical protein
MALSKVTYTDEIIQSRKQFKGPRVTSTQVNAIQDEIIANRALINTRIANEGVSTINGGTGQKACRVNGLTVVTGGTGIADLTLAAPTEGARATIRIGSLSSGSVVVTCAAGVTLNGTNNVATFDAANEALELIYKAANTWEVALNVGGVVLSTAG